jgi:hypothetical protein
MFAVVMQTIYWRSWWTGSHATFHPDKNKAKLFPTQEAAEKAMYQELMAEEPEDEDDYLYYSRLSVIPTDVPVPLPVR